MIYQQQQKEGGGVRKSDILLFKQMIENVEMREEENFVDIIGERSHMRERSLTMLWNYTSTTTISNNIKQIATARKEGGCNYRYTGV